MRKHFFSIVAMCIAGGSLFSQPATTLVKVIVAPDHSDWLYKPNEPVKFTITVLKDGNPLKNVTVKYQVGPEKMEPMKKDSLVLSNGTLSLPSYTLKNSGFLQCIATAFYDGKEYRGLGTAGIEPLSIKPTVANPADFLSFWDKAKATSLKFRWTPA